jgi:dihydrofolate reductase
MIRLIAAIDRKRGIAKDGTMPWRIPEDEKYFTTQTKTHGGNVLTGGKTFRDTYHGKPLVDRQNYILTHKNTSIPGAILVHDLAKFLEQFKGKDLWVAGGAEVFEEVIAAGKADELYLTHIDADLGCDRFFPEYKGKFKLVEQSEVREQNGFKFTYAKYVPLAIK